ncbi:MAG TPA: hypothetical protein VFM48_14955, partial [Aquabacterium sp.]|nr:hypothetical protein [Aquabacterium sp.]
ETARLYAENSMGELLSGFAMLSEHLDALASSPESGRSVQGELEGISVHLQSQDRVAQMLHAVTDDMQRMTSYLNGRDDPAARVPQQWLHRLEASYTMEDMKATHHNQEVVAPPSGVQYF